MLVYALDIGGSSIKHGVVDTTGNNVRIISKGEDVQLATNKFIDLKVEVMKIVDGALLDNKELTAVGISTSGSVDTNGVVVSAGHFDGYTDISWEEIIRSKYEKIKIVKTTNDGRASAWGEYSSYNNESKSHMHIVVGTGVGGGLVYNNELLMGDSGQAGYIGHMKITSDATITCSCGKQGCVETLASAPGIIQHLKSISKKDTTNNFQTIISLAKQGDVDAIEAIKKGGYWLGIGVGNAMNILNPTVVTVGGGVVSGANELITENGKDVYFDTVIEGVKYASHKRVFASCDIRKAQHGNDAGMIGAACLCV
jgi:glucokinase